jgi:hypothetical protein
MVMAAPLSHIDADRCQSPDSDFAICLSEETRGTTQVTGEEDLQSPSTAQTIDLGISDAQHSDPPIPPTVTMRSPTVSAVVAAAATKTTTRPRSTITTTAAAATPSSRVVATKSLKSQSRDGTQTAETLRQKRTASSPADHVSFPAAIEKPVASMDIYPGSGTEENKAPSQGRCKNPIGLPPLGRGRVASAQPASCGKQAALATAAAAASTSPAVVDYQNIMPYSVRNNARELVQVAFAPASASRRATSSKKPIGLGGVALPPPPLKRRRINSTKGAVPVSDYGVFGRQKIKSSRTSSKVDQKEEQRDVHVNIATNAAAAAAVSGPQQQSQRAESRRQRNAETRKKSIAVVPDWVQEAAEAPQVNAVLLSAAEKIKPNIDSTGACPAWKIAEEKSVRQTQPNLEQTDLTVDEEKKDETERQQRPSQDLPITTNTAATINCDDRTDGGIESHKKKALFIPGWEAVLQTADVAPKEYEESETVAEVLAHGASKRAKYNAQKEHHTLLKNNNHISQNHSNGSPAFGSPRSPSENGASSSLKGAFNRADGSLCRQGFGISEFAARVSIVASGLSADEAGKESLLQRAKRVMHGVVSHSGGGAGALVGEGGNEKGGKEEREVGAKAEISNKKINTNLSSAAAATTTTATSTQKEDQKQQQTHRAPFALGHAISNLVAQSLHTRGQTPFLSNRGRYERRKKVNRGGVQAHERRKRQEGRNNKLQSGSGNKIGGGDGGGGGAPIKPRVGGKGGQQRQPLVTSLAGIGISRVMPPPKTWPSLDEQFSTKGSKGRVNLNDLAKGSRLSGSGLDIKLWNKLFKEQAEGGRVENSKK